jgi:hypothetical protein
MLIAMKERWARLRRAFVMPVTAVALIDGNVVVSSAAAALPMARIVAVGEGE